MIKRLLPLLFLLVWSGPAGTQTAITGPGANSCDLFMKFYEQDPETRELLFFAWAQGFMSGMNVVALRLKGEVIDLRPEAYDPDRQMIFIRNFCFLHRGESYAEAVFELMTELRHAAGPPASETPAPPADQ